MDLSDDSFAWSDASNDSDKMAFDIKEENEESLLVNNKRNSTENSNEERPQESKKKSKKRKYEEMAEVSKSDDDKVKQIKSESDSDFEKPKKKKKKKHKDKEISNIEESQDTNDYDDSYLNYKVKQEQLSFAEPAQVKPKKKKRRTLESDSVILEEEDVKNYEIDTDITIEENHLEQIKSEEVEVKKKKKKSKTDISVSNDDLEPSDDNFKSKKKSKSKKRDKDNNSKSFNESEVSQVDEISCIESSKLVNNFLDDDHIMEKSNGDIYNESKEIESKVQETSKSKSLKEVSKISDRLRFEDEESVDFEPKHVEDMNLSKHLKNFLNNRKDLSLIKTAAATGSTITDDDEIWIVKAPHELNIKDFKDVNIKLDMKSKLKFNGQTYDLICDNSIEKASLLSHQKNKAYIRHIPVMGVINLRKRIPKAHIPEENVVVNHQPTFIPLPETKCRHPLFGVNYKKATKISPSIAERLNGGSSSPMLNGDVEKRKKHKKEKRKVEVESELETKPLDDSPVVSKKKRKRKSSVKDEPVSKKAKYIKNESESADVWESEKAIEKNLFDF